jgi:hypothetical protein
LDLFTLLISGIVAVAASLCLMFALDRFGILRRPYIWLAALTLIDPYFAGNWIRHQIERYRIKRHKKPHVAAD